MLVANVGDKPVLMEGLTSSVAWTVQGTTVFEAEGVVFSSGQTIQWLRDRLGVFGPDDDIEALARSVPDNGGVYLVPAFAGLCAPHWDRDARAAIVGLSLASGAGHVVRAGLEAMAYQTRDNVDTLVRGGIPVPELRVDGGATRNALLCQFQADILGVPVVRPNELERTALGVAYLAGSGVGRWRVPDDVEASWTVDRVFEPEMSEDRRAELYDGWCAAVRHVAPPPHDQPALQTKGRRNDLGRPPEDRGGGAMRAATPSARSTCTATRPRRRWCWPRSRRLRRCSSRWGARSCRTWGCAPPTSSPAGPPTSPAPNW